MSLRLPSQNKFRPTVRPGLKKGPPPKPAQPRPAASSSQQTIAPASSQSQTPSSSQTAVPSSSAPLASPSSTLVQAQSQSHPPSLGTTSKSPIKSPTAVISRPIPIPSQQVRRIRASQSPTKEPATLASPTRQVTEEPAAAAAATATPAPPVPQPPTPQSASSQPPPPSQPSVSSSSTVPLGPKLSLLDAARNHSSAAPSPGAIRRGTPSISSRSVRAPSSTPQPAPRFSRAPSSTPQPQRAPSVPPSAQRPPSAAPSRPRAPSATPQAPASASTGLPPSLGVQSSPAPTQTSFGLPPSLGTSLARPAQSSPPPKAGPVLDTAALAAAVVASIMPPQAPIQPVLKGKRRVTQARVTPASGTGSDEGSQTKRASRPRKKAPPVRLSTEERGTSEDVEEDGEESDEDEVDENGVRKKRRSNSTRPSKRTKVSKPKRPAVAVVSLEDIQPEDMVGDAVDEGATTMGDLATVLAAQGRVSQRAVKIDEFRRVDEQKKREESRLRSEDSWRRNQIKRRKVRATKNADRARRREELGQLGMDEAAVSPDEDDSEEEYEPQPERLTPESTPEPDAMRDSQPPERGEDEYEDRSEGDREDWEMGDAAAEGEVNQEGEEALFFDGGLEDGSQFGGGLANGDDAAQAEDDEDMAALRAAGFLVTNEDEQGEGDDFDDEPWLRGEEPDIEGYRQALEQRRRRVIEEHDRDDQEVVEVDDETRFINNASFAKYTKPIRWTAVETELFYQVLEETGENYTLMKAYFPGRTAKQLKLKGLKENRLNPDKMTAAILARRPIDKDYLTKSAGYDPHRSWDKEEALFEEARVDANKLRRLDSVRPDGEGEGEGEDVGDVTLQEHEKDDEDEDGKSGDDKSDDEGEAEAEAEAEAEDGF